MGGGDEPGFEGRGRQVDALGEKGVEERREPTEQSFPEVKGEIRRRLLSGKVQTAYGEWLRKRWEEAQIEILDSTLTSIKKGRELGS